MGFLVTKSAPVILRLWVRSGFGSRMKKAGQNSSISSAWRVAQVDLLSDGLHALAQRPAPRNHPFSVYLRQLILGYQNLRSSHDLMDQLSIARADFAVKSTLAKNAE